MNDLRFPRPTRLLVLLGVLGGCAYAQNDLESGSPDDGGAGGSDAQPPGGQGGLAGASGGGAAGQAGGAAGSSGGGGDAGSAGSSGTGGAAGTAGTSGTAGSAGTSGTGGAAGTGGSGASAGSAGTSGTSGSGGTGGSAGSAGSSGMSGSSGTAGTGGSGGSAGSAGSGGTGGSAGSAGTSGSGGTGGSAGSAGTSGSGGTGGSAGSAGTSGTSGSGGAAGTGGSGGSVDPCQGVSCTAPPPARCDDASILRTFTAPGTCSNGLCSYPERTDQCLGGCQSGACQQSCPSALTLGSFASGSDGWTFDGLWRYSGGAMVAGSTTRYSSSYSQSLTQGQSVDLSGCGAATLSFEVKLSDDALYDSDPTDRSERLYVECSGDGGVSWAAPLTPNPAPPNQNGCGNSYCAGKEGLDRSFGWTAQSITLPSECLKATMKVRFRAAGSSAWRLYNPGWLVRNVAVRG